MPEIVLAALILALAYTAVAAGGGIAALIRAGMYAARDKAINAAYAAKQQQIMQAVGAFAPMLAQMLGENGTDQKLRRIMNSIDDVLDAVCGRNTPFPGAVTADPPGQAGMPGGAGGPVPERMPSAT